MPFLVQNFWCLGILNHLRVNVEFQIFKANKNGTVFISSTKGPLVSTLDVTKSREKWKKKMEEASKSAKTTLCYAMSLNSCSTKTGKISETSKFNWSMQKLHLPLRFNSSVKNGKFHFFTKSKNKRRNWKFGYFSLTLGWTDNFKKYNDISFFSTVGWFSYATCICLF